MNKYPCLEGSTVSVFNQPNKSVISKTTKIRIDEYLTMSSFHEDSVSQSAAFHCPKVSEKHACSKPDGTLYYAKY